ncbi:catalase-like domain-containing protein [Halteromyces radiatus]|uniref:catalase-like domain-containing protein n=1 Tax=Halteromyces radiatus TaxID=101107 RepID=UPI00222044A6|nr:catalase-like domain-containing protein [Halteromyces radiatus]KAI8096278.1 catalase-like domain-containing protein [Halteromyces radiatus]
MNQLNKYVIDETGSEETTNFGQKINNTQSLKAGKRGPTLMEDIAFREKMLHFDHERIPERVVHARGVGAHGYFETYKDWSDLTAASFLRTPNQKTPVFVRFSTVLGFRGSPDTVRDVRGFATRFYTDEGNFDLVGNIIAPFFVHDAIKFPDIIHAGKPQPDREIPQAGTAHDTAYDFFSQFPETLHTVLWALSGRGIPTNFRQVEGFGVHTYRLINEQGKAVFVKFIWKPLQGLCNLVWDEAQKIAGKDIDFHRNDLYNAIDRGDYPQWEFGVQIIEEKDEHAFDFDLLDPTKIVPESLVPFTPLGKMTLNRNVTNFFAETEQITFCVGHIVRGIGFTDDSLLQGRLMSYFDTQINRMGSANYMQLPINQPLNQVHNNQRDGSMQFHIHKGEVSYYPNTLQGNAPALPVKPYIEYPEQVNGQKVRDQVPSVEDAYSHPQLFWNSLTDHEKQQLVDGARFEIGKCQYEVRDRMVNILNHVDNSLARRVAVAIGITPPDKVVDNLGKTSKGLSIEQYKKPDNIRTRTVAILTAPGTNTNEAKATYDFLKSEGAYVEYVGVHLGDQDGLNITQTYLTTASVLWDAVYVPGGEKGIDYLSNANTSFFPAEEPLMFVVDSFRHGKPIAATNEGVKLLEKAGLDTKAPGMVLGRNVDNHYFEDLKAAIQQQRFWDRLPMDQ